MEQSLHLNQEELKKIVEDWARDRGMAGKLAVSLQHELGDRPGDPDRFGATVTCDVEFKAGK